ncbi:nucleoporin protein ndc1-Nup domain-containing protein [Sarocladium implicatum]|nr:nucleoporin protein ndc1-Nup domain-containing protein [Sarocladium implicatum]
MAGITVRRAPYKDFLQPALQRRFSLTATILLVVSYLEALLTADWESFFWSAFPIGPAGFRTLFIFACGLAILVLRIAHYHVGRRTLTPGAQVLYTSLSTLSTYETAFWYVFSSLSYALVFVWSSPSNANLRWVIYFGGNRARLNERPIFLMCYMGVLALLQTWAHYEIDMDRLDLRLMKKKEVSKEKAVQDGSATMKPFLQLFPAIFSDTLVRAIYALPIAFVFYFAIFRSFAWSWTLMFFRPFYQLPKTNMAPPTWPSDLWLFGRCMYGGIMVSLLWAVGNAAFTASMAQEPLKNGKALTSESKDPNGSLLNGLKSKKNTVKAFAMWELAHIAEEDQVRRQAIYEDIDRKDGPMWAQVYGICMELLKGIDSRVETFGKPVVSSSVAPEATATQQRASAALQDDVFLAKASGRPTLKDGVRKAIGQVSQSPGSPPSKQLSPLAKKTWKDAKDHLLTQEQQEFLSPDNMKGQFETLARYLVSVPKIGELFHQDFAARFAGVVLGSPFAEPTLYCNATRALCSLAVHSLGEDQYGNVHRDVPSIIRTLTATIRKIEALKARFPLHWTDSKGIEDCPDVDLVLDTLREGLSLVVTAFEPFSTDLRLTLGDLRHAKEAAIKPEPVKPEEKKVEATKPEDRRRAEPARNDRKPQRRRVQEDQRLPEMQEVTSTGRARS